MEVIDKHKLVFCKAGVVIALCWFLEGAQLYAQSTTSRLDAMGCDLNSQLDWKPILVRNYPFGLAPFGPSNPADTIAVNTTLSLTNGNTTVMNNSVSPKALNADVLADGDSRTIAPTNSATWQVKPASGNWNDLLNWMPSSIPNGPADTAAFGLSTFTNVFLSANTEVNGIAFNAGASAYTISASPTFTLTLSGSGITNDSGIGQNFVAAVDSAGHSGTIMFTGSATAGNLTTFTANGSLVANIDGGVITFRDISTAGMGTFVINGGATSAGNGGSARFYDDSSAGSARFAINGGAVTGGNWGEVDFYGSSMAGQATFTNNGAAFGELGNIGGFLVFHDASSAANAVIVNNGGTASSAAGSFTFFRDNSIASGASIQNNGGAAAGAIGGDTVFQDSSSAGNATIINSGALVSDAYGASTAFLFNSSAGASTLIANAGPGPGVLVGGMIDFEQDSEGGTARVEVFGNGFLDIHNHNAPGLTIGSLEGTGRVFLGDNNLSVGSNNLSTEFSGGAHDGHPFGGDLVGGSLTKIGTGTFTLSGANTYTGPTIVSAGKLIINGSITSAVTVNGGTLSGSGSVRGVSVNSGGTLSPGNSPGILEVAGNLALTLGATYLVDLDGAAVGTQYDQANVGGAVSLGSATLALTVSLKLAPGTIFNIISNDLTDPVTGIFAGLPEGATFAQGGQTFVISYQGGDGNDVVLTAVVPEPATLALFCVGVTLLAWAARWGEGRS
jgi:autotransporter-associated beta strand protein